MKEIKKIGVLTSGGDAPGMNAAIRAIARTALNNGIEVVGIYRGYRGLLEGDLKDFQPRDVSNIINHGGTILYSDRCMEFATPEGLEKALKTAFKAVPASTSFTEFAFPPILDKTKTKTNNSV